MKTALILVVNPKIIFSKLSKSSQMYEMIE